LTFYVRSQRYVEKNPVGKLQEHPQNPNEGDLGAIEESIDELGFFGACLAQESTGYILAGNHRWKAAIQKGAAYVPTLYIDCDDDVALKILLGDNRIADLRTYNNSKLADVLSELRARGAGLRGTGYTSEDLTELLSRMGRDRLADAGYDENGAPLEGDGEGDRVDQRVPYSGRDVDDQDGGGDAFDPTPAPSDQPSRTRLGDLWQLGNHRLLVGDSTDPESVARLFGATGVEGCDLVLTDPPYGVEYVGKTADALRIQNDNLGANGTRALVGDFLRIAPLKPGASFYICSPGGDMYLSFLLGLADAELQLRQSIVWVKQAFVMGRQDYHWRHEMIMYGWKDGAAHYFIADRTQDTVWEIDRPMRSLEHPTMKPIPLFAKAIANSTREDSDAVIYEPFAGSGTAIIAAERSARRCFAVELSPFYADVIVRRWEAEAGREAVLLDRLPEADPVSAEPAA
jgi:DNA modification methylase